MLGKPLLTLLPLLFALSAQAWETPKCESIRQRKEWRTLEPDEQQTYLKTVRKLMESDFYDKQSKLHGDAARTSKGSGYIHGSPHFLPWHRWFIWNFEQELRKIEKSISLPYWDAAFDSQAPELAPVWGDDMFGGNGVGEGNCVATGIFKDWKPKYSKFTCFARKWNGGDTINAFTGPEEINAMIARSVGDFDTFRIAIEGLPHGLVHNNIDGDMKTMNSPNDPLFYLHHSNVDRHWWLWQKLDSKNADAYNGKNKDTDDGKKGGTADKTDVLFMVPSELKVTVADMMDTKKLCYEYKEMSMDDTHIPELPPAQTGDTSGGGAKLVRRAHDFISPLIKFVRRGSADDEAYQVDPTAIVHKATDAAAPLKPQTKVEVIKPADPNIKPAVVKPVDNHVTVTKAPEKEQIKTDDRKVMNKLNDPSSLSEEWLTINGLNITQIRILEKITQNSTQAVNHVSGYVSRAALWNRPDMMIKIVEKKGSDEFSVDVNGTRIVVTKGSGSQSNPKQTAANIIGRVKESLQGKVQRPIAQVAECLAKIIGPPIATNPRDSSNPYAPRVEGSKGIAKDSEEAKKLEEKISILPLKKLEEKVTKEDIKECNKTAKNQEQKATENQEAYAVNTKELAKDLKEGKWEGKRKGRRKHHHHKKGDKEDDKKEDKKDDKKDDKEDKKDDKKEDKNEDKKDRRRRKGRRKNKKGKKKEEKKEEEEAYATS